MSTEFEAVIGLEVHAQLSTRSKIFCSCPAQPTELSNQHVCPVCTAQPGSLPVLNRQVLRYAVMAGLAVGCKIQKHSTFARKNYFYPDLPKGYQISQYDEPICQGGFIEIPGRKVRLNRIHIEEDAGKNVHMGSCSLVNLNRAGVPLIEIVTEPDLHTPEEAGAYLRSLYGILTFLGICDGNLQEGNFRCDANVSVRPKGETRLGTRTEIKNVNSFRFIEESIGFEIRRQVEIIRAGKRVVQETRGYDPSRHATHTLRSKEEAQDYRYFPDPDLMPVTLESSWISEIQGSLPELPHQKRVRYAENFGLGEQDLWAMTGSRGISDYFDACMKTLEGTHLSVPQFAKLFSNWIAGEMTRLAHDSKVTFPHLPVSPQVLMQIVKLTVADTVSSTGAKQILETTWRTGESPEVIVAREGLEQVSDRKVLEEAVKKIVAAYPTQVAEYKAGKQKVMGFLVGQVMKQLAGRANPSIAQEILRELLK